MKNTLYILSIALLTSAGHLSAQAIPNPMVRDTGTIDTLKLVDTSSATAALRNRARSRIATRSIDSLRSKPVFSFLDSLREQICSERYNQKPALDRSFSRSAGDYFRYTPNFFALPYRETPMRTTVSPFGLPGNHMSWIAGGHAVTLFEHVPEADGMADAEDLPTATDDAAYVVPGPAGLLFGGEQAAGSLITRPRKLTNTDFHSDFLVDKGWDGYAQTRGRLDKLFSNGRKFDGSISYRQAGGSFSLPADNTYHYTGSLYTPISSHYALSTDGWLFERRGGISVEPDSTFGLASVTRHHFERHLLLSLIRSDSAHTTRTEIGYEHNRQGSHLDLGYHGAFDFTGHSVFARREWIAGGSMFRVNAEGQTLKYDNGIAKNDRTNGDISLSVTRPISGWQSAFVAGTRYAKSFGSLPYAALSLKRETPHSLIHASAGYTQRAPTQHELLLPYQQTTIPSSGLYADSGNINLSKEKQMIGSVYGELGTIDNAINLSAAGGRITNAIDWVRLLSGNQVTTSPTNVTLSFSDIAATTRLKFSDVIRFNAGFGYHNIDRADNGPKYYSPEFIGYGGMELHLYWSQKLIHFYGYGELVYTGRYHGYVESNLGKSVIANSTLSFSMGPYRMHFVFRNMFAKFMDSRDYFATRGQYFTYGFVWSFVN